MNGVIPVYTAHFTPEAWQGGEAVEVAVDDHPRSWDCTAYASQHMPYLTRVAAARGESTDAPDGVLDNDDVFKDDPAAPQWIRDWRGPFTIRITEGPSLSRTNLARLSEAIGGVLGTDPETARWHAAQVMGAQEAMRRESGETGDNTGGYPPEYGPWSVEPTALAAWVTYRELKGE